MLQQGTQIAYIPSHVREYFDSNLDHPDVEFGFVVDLQGEENAWCRYWLKGKPGFLRTRANSELTPIRNLVEYKSVSQYLVIDWFQSERERISGSQMA